MDFFVRRIFPLIFMAAGAVALLVGLRSYELARESLDWPTTEGVILSSEVKRQRSRNHEGRSSVTYKAEVRYAFETGGMRHEGRRVRYGEYSSSDGNHARRTVERYPPGTAVEVRYDPENPLNAVLEPGPHSGSWLLPGLGGTFFLVGLVLNFYLSRSARSAERTKPGFLEARDRPPERRRDGLR